MINGIKAGWWCRSAAIDIAVNLSMLVDMGRDRNALVGAAKEKRAWLIRALRSEYDLDEKKAEKLADNHLSKALRQYGSIVQEARSRVP